MTSKPHAFKIRPVYLLLLVFSAVFVLAVYKAGLIKAFFITHRVHRDLAPEFSSRHLTWGKPVFIRIFKEEKQLELWLEKDGSYELFATYPVCSYSGKLGPKVAEGDHQAPEGFYTIRPSSMVPGSAFHLSFDIGFPNEYDRAQGRTGSHLMVHGACVSVGCYAMTDSVIENVYTLMQAAFDAGQREVPVHIFPFRLTAENLVKHSSHHGPNGGRNFNRLMANLKKRNARPKFRLKTENICSNNLISASAV
jgi:murein L,D-transpeptidase YafK